MIEEIKKKFEIIFSNYFNSNTEYSRMFKKDMLSLLDKYKDKEDKYKSAWEELELMINSVAFDKVRKTMQELEQKYNLECDK